MRQLVSILGAVGVCACADAHQPVGERPTLASCTANWSELLSLQTGAQPNALVIHDGVLYYYDESDDSPGIVALSVDDGAPTRLVDDGGSIVEVDDERLFFARFDQLFAVPIAGGAVELVADGNTFGPSHSPATIVSNQVLADDYLYWLLRSPAMESGETLDDWSVWRMSRTGGDPEQLGVLPRGLRVLWNPIVLADQLLIATGSGALVLSKNGGAVRELPVVVDGVFVGAGASGVLSRVERRTDRDATGRVRASEELVLSKLDGSEVRRFWKDAPGDVFATEAWFQPDGSWLTLASETFSDGKVHLSVWSLDRDGHGTRLGCDPVDGEPHGDWPTLRFAAAWDPDALYFTVLHLGSDGAPDYWKLIRVGR